jgi:FKBP-type peptidyl-prolyl cis-trans isomerase FklB
MKLPVFVLLTGLAAGPLFAAEGSLNLTDQKERTSYALGVNFGSNLKKNDIDVNLDTVRKGIEDALGGKPQLSDAEMGETFKQLQTQMAARREEKAKADKALGEKWLAENATKPGVQKAPSNSGLQYKIVQDGSGDSPKAMDKVSVKYTGKLLDGTVFDSTDQTGGQPRQFMVNGVIKGWSEALQMMKKGAKWELYIPSDLAYGPGGNPRGRVPIPPNSVLIFEVELVDIIPTPVPPTPQQPVTSDIIKVPSADELKKGAKIEILKPEDVEKEIAKEKARKEAEQKPEPKK